MYSSSIFPLILVTFISSFGVGQDSVSKTIIHFCHPQSNPCGPKGICQLKATGNRCRCTPGWMGQQCKRPCQDIYKSCDRWESEKRCQWATNISPFFEDNCAATCRSCVFDPRIRLSIPLAPILEPLGWLIGVWQTDSTSSLRFPVPMTGPYRETMSIQISEVPMFDRPPLNFTAKAITRDGRDQHVDVGFITSKPFDEDTGFVVFNKPQFGADQVGVEINSNTGVNTIEEGVMNGTQLQMKLTFVRSFFADEQRYLKSASRSFRLMSMNRLEEVGEMQMHNGQTLRWYKIYDRIEDYLKVL